MRRSPRAAACPHRACKRIAGCAARRSLRMTLHQIACFAWICAALMTSAILRAETPASIDIGSRRELFVDHFLIDKLDRATLRMHRPVDRGSVLAFDKRWEGVFCAYVTITHHAH